MEECLHQRCLAWTPQRWKVHSSLLLLALGFQKQTLLENHDFTYSADAKEVSENTLVLLPSSHIVHGDFWIQGAVKRKGKSRFELHRKSFLIQHIWGWMWWVSFNLQIFVSIFIFYYSEDLIGVENIFLNLNRSRMLIASKLTLFSCQNSSKSFHAAKASCTNMRHLPTGSIRFHFMQGPCGSHKLIEVMLTKKNDRVGSARQNAGTQRLAVTWRFSLLKVQFLVTWHEI